MHGCASVSSRAWWCSACVLVCASWSGAAPAAEFVIESATTAVHEHVYELSAQIRYELSADTIEALDSGVPLFIAMDIEIWRERRWWPDDSVAVLQQRYLLVYHALSERYVVHNLRSGAQANYGSLRAALSALGKVERLPLIDEVLLQRSGPYLGRMRVYLEIESLPAPVQPLAYLSPSWRLESDWYTWQFKQ